MIVAVYCAATGRLMQGGRLGPNDPLRAPLRGEAFLQVREETFDAWLQAQRQKAPIDPLQAYISQITGLAPKDDRYVVVRGTQIVAWAGNIHPSCWPFDEFVAQFPNAQFIAHPAADERWTYLPVSGDFVSPPDPIIVKGAVSGG